MRYIYLSFLILLIILSACTKQVDNTASKRLTNLTGAYFGQLTPGNEPEVFMPKLISTHYEDRDAAFSPGNNEFYFTIFERGCGTILFLTRINHAWSRPQVAPFSGKYSDLEPFITSDGNKLFFVSNRSLIDTSSVKDYDIYFVERKDEKSPWSKPINIGNVINTNRNEFYPTLSKNGNLYFSAAYDSSFGGEDIYLSKYENGTYQKPINLGKNINSECDEFNALISPDENFILFSSYGRKDEIGGGDIYISYRINDTTWTDSKILGSNINSTYLDYCPSISPDGKYLFFTSKRISENFIHNKPYKLQDLFEIFDSFDNGKSNIYWIDISAITK